METNEKEQVYQSGSSDSLNQPDENQSQHQQANYDDEMAPRNGNTNIDGEDEDDLDDDNLDDNDLDDDDLDDDDLDDEEMDKEDTMGTGGEMSREDDRGRLGTMTAS